VHAFDPSPESIRWVATQQLPPGLHFHALALAGRDGFLTLRARQEERSGTPIMYSAVDKARSGSEVRVSCQSLHTITERLRHRSLALVKLDIEGAEYDVLRSMLASSLMPRQVLVEFHHRFAGIDPADTVTAVRDLRTAGYRLAFISDTGRELTFLLDRQHRSM
jgi:FkbM family methyltransferase